MNNHPITNLPMLDERNYRSWEPMVRRQFEARDLVMFIDYTNPTTGLDVPRHALRTGALFCHCAGRRAWPAPRLCEPGQAGRRKARAAPERVRGLIYF